MNEPGDVTVRRITSISRILQVFLLFFALLGATAANAQSVFRVKALVNGSAITGYEFSQRQILLQVLRTPGDLSEHALEALVNERLQFQAATAAGFSVSEADIDAGVAEMAARTELRPDAYLSALTEAGVDLKAFREFVRVSVLWRSYIRAKYAPLSSISDAEVDQALSLLGTTGSTSVQISELFLPANTPEMRQQNMPLAVEISKVRSESEFARAAQAYSVGASRAQGGRVEDWIPLANLPPAIARLVADMQPGEVTQPLDLPNAIALFQLRSVRDEPAPAPTVAAIDYAIFFAQDDAEAHEVAAQIDSCDDLYGITKNEPEKLDRKTSGPGSIPRDLALALAKLDVNESTTIPGPAGTDLVMLCQRIISAENLPGREDVRQQLYGQRLAGFAELELDALRAEANIQIK